MPADAGNLQALAGAPLLSLTTIGRKTQEPRTVELWFVYHRGAIYLLGHAESHWFRNLARHPRVTLEIDDASFEGTARLDDSKREMAYQLFQRKYGAQQVSYWYGGQRSARRTVEIALVLTAH